MKKSIVTVFLASLSGFAFANLTYTPLTDDSSAWTQKEGAFDYANGVYKGQWPNWTVYGSVYDLGQTTALWAKNMSIKFSYDVTSYSSINNFITVAFQGTTQTIVTGRGVYNSKDAQVAVSTNTTASMYAFSTCNDSNAVKITTGYESVSDVISGVGQTATLFGTIQWSEAADQFVLTYGTASSTVSVNLGQSVDISKIVITADAGNANNSHYAQLSNFSVEIIPEPATATLSLLALAGLCARRRRK